MLLTGAAEQPGGACGDTGKASFRKRYKGGTARPRATRGRVRHPTLQSSLPLFYPLQIHHLLEDTAMWTKPAYSDLRIGFEVTMYFAHR